MGCKDLTDTISMFANIAIVISVVFLLFQLAEMRRTTLTQSYGIAREILQAEEVRQARKIVFQLGRKGKKINRWSDAEIKSAEIVCHTYDSVGQMARNNLLKRKIIISSWGHSVQGTWTILEPLVKKYRAE